MELVLGGKPLVACHTMDRPIGNRELAAVVAVEVLAGGFGVYARW